MNIVVNRVNWPQTHRLIMSHYPPIDLFDDVADPRDWEALAIAQARTNPRLSGDGASWVMAAFTHVSPDRVSRFSNGSYGVYYAGDTLETALREHTFHMARFYAASSNAPGWISQVRQLIGSIDSDLADIREGNHGDILDPDVATYPSAQAFARRMKDEGVNGIVYPSQRHCDGECIAAFYPDVVTPPRQGDHFRYHWNGREVDFVQKVTGQRTVFDLGGN